MKKRTNQTHANPIATLNRAWQITERVMTAVALIMVAGTVGLVSLHILA